MTGAGGVGRGDRGSGTVLVLAASVLVVALAAAVLVAGRVLGLRVRAATAADLAALAAADRLVEGPAAACAAAAEVARRNRARLASCVASADDVTVTTEVDLPGLAAPLGPVRVVARAGPGPPGG